MNSKQGTSDLKPLTLLLSYASIKILMSFPKTLTHEYCEKTTPSRNLIICISSSCRVNAYPYLPHIVDTTSIIPWTVKSPIIILIRKFINNINFTFGESNQLLLHQFLWNSTMHEIYLYDFIIVSSKFCRMLHVYAPKLGLIKIHSTWTK